MSQQDKLLELHDDLHVLYAALNGLIADGGNEDARAAVSEFAGKIMNKVGLIASTTIPTTV